MKKRKKVIIIVGSIILVTALILAGIFIGHKVFQKTVPMPSIAFLYTSTWGDYLFICSDGAILKATEEVFDIPYDERVTMIEEKRYEDIFEQVGDTNPETVQKMYNLFVKVVLRGNYRKKYKSLVDIPERERTGETWNAYYEKDGKIVNKEIYRTLDEIEVSDKRALKIVDWMNEVLKPYKSPKVREPKERTKEDYPIPGIAFVYTSTWGDYLLICSDGKILKADKDKMINYPFEERVKMAEEENYKDVMEYIGDTDAEKVREMYDIFVDLVLLGDNKGSYALKGKKEMAYWIAYYYYNYDEEEEIDSKELYETDDEIENIDERILGIVDWINEVLEPYK